MKSRFISVDLESKRLINNSDYLVTNGDNNLLLIPNSLITVTDGSTDVLITNLSNNDQTIQFGESIGFYESINDCTLIDTSLSLIQNQESFSDEILSSGEEGPSLPEPDDFVTTHKFELGEIKLGNHLSNEERTKLIDLLIEYKDVMAFDGHLGLTDLIEYQIDIDRSQPVHVPPYRVSPQQRDDIVKQAKTMLDQGVIEPCRSPWSSPIILVKKPQHKGGGFRFVTDFRQVNKLTKNWIYELPLINDYLRSLSGYKIFCSLDANSGFYQIPVKEEDRDITAFIIPGYGSFRYKTMPMGAKTSAQTYQCLMDIALGSLKYTATLVYMDDLLIPGIDFNDMLSKLKLVFNALRTAGITLKPNKCTLATKCLRFLGHVVNENGIFTDIKKIKAISELPEPKTPKAVRQFLGKCAYYNDFIKDFSIIASPLYELTKLDNEFNWTDDHNNCFQ